MRYAIAAIAVFLLASHISAEKAPPTKLQIGIKARNPDPNCVKSKDGDLLSMDYTGTLWSNGKQFDTSIGRGPFTFNLGEGSVIQGWDQGLRGMCVGEKRKLIIPSDLAYGDRAAGAHIPANSALVFEVELLELNGVGKDGKKSDEESDKSSEDTKDEL
ncbi:FK506-binding protein 2A [Lobosporangium transversale]|uniref:peptidylprolyl isomerase n=1 Tax=Lobosporangium transversale TaxID=64571 RepID=A0A1Y2GAE4_9FUNG|nr:FK506-binding protein 2 precursor [Lobosporangium transversale]KAF9919379.1 FK506-binding protein 2A [Lobosporangium transversale]ORZ05524.1 FK506-binding protein 2 precursor [Lobosporangium transversale]|eukprot:XP_021877098.1 FK506-binding protein 2 precursor [Lobosporangium transversale]